MQILHKKEPMERKKNLALSNIAEERKSLRIPKLHKKLKLSMNFQNISIQILLHEHMYQSLIIDQDTLTTMLIGPGEIYLNQLQKRFLYFFLNHLCYFKRKTV